MATGQQAFAPAHDGPPPELLQASFTRLRGLGLLAHGNVPGWSVLGGGVSNWVLLIHARRDVVVKGALARLRVRDEWLADPRRAVVEGRAMQVLSARLPEGDLPRVLFVDEEHYLLGMERAPGRAGTWKEALLRGEVDQQTALEVGALLGRMHAAAWGDSALAEEFGDLSLFRQLRLDPYHEHTAQVLEGKGRTDLAAELRARALEMAERRVTLVHGDYSPKNLLAQAGKVMALDFEVVHWGNPDFDTAFLLTHLVLKSVHTPVQAGAFREAASGFLTAYCAALGHRDSVDVAHGALRQVGCLLLARVDGKSPAEYLGGHGRARAWKLGAEVLQGRITDVDQLFEGAEADG